MQLQAEQKFKTWAINTITYQRYSKFIRQQVTQAGSFSDQVFLTNQTGRSTIGTISVPPTLNRTKTAGYSRNKHMQSLFFQRAL